MGPDEVLSWPRCSMAAAASARRPNKLAGRWNLSANCRSPAAYPPKAAWIAVLPHRSLDLSLTTRSCRCNGCPLKDVKCQEKFGDGIMSAIDFTSMWKKSKTPAALASVSHVWQVPALQEVFESLW